MEFRVLGPIEALHGGVSLALGGPKQRSVLALLIASAGRPVSVGSLIQGVYGDDAADGARRTIHTYVSNLRREVGDVITKAGDGYLLVCDRIDAQDFERLFREGTDLVDERPDRAAGILREALALWRGRAYADVEGRSALDSEIARLEELRLAAIDARVEADLAVGLHRELIGELEGLTAEHPLRESFRAHHMVALYRSGRQSEALRAFGRTRTLLAEELGIDPSPELRDLELAILSQDPKLDVRIKATIEARAVLAAELDDGVRHLSHRERDRALFDRDESFGAAVAAAGGTQLGVRGMAVYAAFADTAAALTAARTLAGGNLRLAMDFGEVEISAETTSGPPIGRALRLAAVAHPGQVLLSADAHTRLSAERTAGWSVLSLGSFDIRGLDGPMPVFQLAGNDLPVAYPDLLIDRLPPPMPDRHTSGSVPGYELRDELGGGPAGAVYRAYQASIGREVAVRVIRPDVVADPRFIRRFEATAQRVAAISHPHLVELLDYWRDPAQAFLVYRLIDGGSLTQVVGSPLRVIEQVGAALAAAHDAGMPHGRVRPESVLLDGEGNAYVSGLGVVSMLHDLVPFPADAFTAPEVIGGDATVAGDVYSLGSLAAALMAGPTPSDGPPLSITGRLGEVIARATDPDLAQRQPGVRELVAQLAAAMDGPAPRGGGPVRNPYKGLAAFQEADAVDFFGRSAVVGALIEATRANPLTVVVGPSGIGKSSVVRAGLVPALRRGALPGSEEWLFTDMFPGSRPFDELEVALARVATRPPADQIDLLRSGRTGLVEAAQALLPPGATLLIVVDQFEELFTHVVDEEVRRRFLDLLVDVHRRSDSPVRVVVTLRADFFDRPLRNAAFGELLDQVLVTVPAPTTEELAEIVAWPGRGVGLHVDESLVATLVADADGESGGLPLLQQALTELFETRDGGRLTLASYAAAGGLEGSIGRRAGAIYEGLSDEDRATAREVFVRLVTVDENAEDTRKRVRISELEGIGVPRTSVDRVLDAFGRHRLLVFDRDSATRGPTVEVAHEALIRHWDRLGTWVDERREALLTHRRVEVATRDWLASGRDPSYLVAGARLEQAEALGEGLGRAPDEAAFLTESRRAVEEAKLRSRRSRRSLVTGLAAALVVSLVVGTVASLERAEAEQARIRARVNELASLTELAKEEDPDLPILLALEAYETSKELVDERVPGSVMAALHNSIQQSRLVGILPVRLVSITVDPRTGLVFGALLDDPATVVGVDPQTGVVKSQFHADSPVGFLDFTADGSVLAVSFGDAGIGPADGLDGASAGALVDGRTFEIIEQIEGPCCGYDIEFDPGDDLLRIEIVNEDVAFTRVLDMTTGEVTETPGWLSAWVGESGRIAVVKSGEPGISVVDARTGAHIETIDTGDFFPESIDASDDGTMFVAASRVNRQVQAWRSGEEGPFLVRDDPGPLVAEFVSNDEQLVVLGNAATQYVVDVDSGDTLELAGNIGGSFSGAALDDDRLVVAASDAVRVWDITTDGPPELQAVAFDREVIDFVPNDEGRMAAVSTTGPDGADARLLDLADGTTVFQTALYNWWIWGWPQISANGAVLGASTFADQPEGVLVDVATGEQTVLGPCDLPKAISDDGRLAVVSADPRCEGSLGSRVVSVADGSLVADLGEEGIASASFGPADSPAADLVAVLWDSGFIELFHSQEGSDLAGYDTSDFQALFPFFSVDGQYLTISNMLGIVEVFDVAAILDGATFEDSLLQVFEGGPDAGQRMEASLRFAVSTHAGAEVKVWDRERGDLWISISTNANNGNVATISPDERFLWYEDGSSVIRRLSLVPEELLALARSRLNRTFTVDECERFLIDTDCSVYEET